MAGRKERTRFVGFVPEFVGFVPDGILTGDTVELAYDELEVIRLLDLENMSQEEAAARMGVSRTTVTGIYERARSKVADSLVNGKRLRIEGGNVRRSRICICRQSQEKGGPYEGCSNV